MKDCFAITVVSRDILLKSVFREKLTTEKMKERIGTQNPKGRKNQAARMLKSRVGTPLSRETCK
jgi:hypothetical protein